MGALAPSIRTFPKAQKTLPGLLPHSPPGGVFCWAKKKDPREFCAASRWLCHRTSLGTTDAFGMVYVTVRTQLTGVSAVGWGLPATRCWCDETRPVCVWFWV